MIRGFVQTCLEFHVTHDAGNPVVHWMHSMPLVNFPGMIGEARGLNLTKWKVRPHILGFHSVGRKCLSCPTVREMHSVYANLSYPEGPYEYTWHNVTGFLQTETFQRFGSPSEWKEWHTMPASDCQVAFNPTPINAII